MVPSESSKTATTKADDEEVFIDVLEPYKDEHNTMKILSIMEND